MFQAVVELVPGARGKSLASHADRRSSDRTPADIEASVRARGSSLRIRAEVVDISTDGCRIHTTDYTVGDDILIALAHLAPISGRICWVREGAVGVQFGTRLHPSIVSHLASL
jgi:lambda repressor-like predicted transcriptional regulator